MWHSTTVGQGVWLEATARVSKQLAATWAGAGAPLVQTTKAKSELGSVPIRAASTPDVAPVTDRVSGARGYPQQRQSPACLSLDLTLPLRLSRFVRRRSSRHQGASSVDDE